MSEPGGHLLAPLTGLRGVAAYSVLTAHAMDTAFSYGGVSIFHRFDERLAYFGMSLFFVLSGFVIHYNYSESFTREGLIKAVYKFFVARFSRLYPLYACSIIISLPHIPAPIFVDHPGVFISFVTLTQSWFNVEMAIFPPDWSISTECFFYVAFIPFVMLTGRINRPVLALALHCALAVLAMAFLLRWLGAPLIRFVQQWLYLDDRVSAGPWGWIIYFSPLVRLPEFIAGMLAAKAYASLHVLPPARRTITAVLWLSLTWSGAVILIGSVSHHPLIGNLLSNIIFAPAIAPLMLCVCLARGRLSRILSSRLFVFMGEISYSVYVWSFFVLSTLGPSLNSVVWAPEAAVNSALKVIIAVVGTTVVAYGSYNLLEAPSRRWLRLALISPMERRSLAKLSSRDAPSNSEKLPAPRQS